MGPTNGSYQWVRPMGPTNGSDQWVRPMGPTNGSYQWVRPMGPTNGSGQRVQPKGLASSRSVCVIWVKPQGVALRFGLQVWPKLVFTSPPQNTRSILNFLAFCWINCLGLVSGLHHAFGSMPAASSSLKPTSARTKIERQHITT